MQCDECKGWYHEVCTNLTPAAFKRFSKKGCVWLCQQCCSDANSLLTEAISLVDAAKKCFSKHSRNASNSTRSVDTQINVKETKVSSMIDDSCPSKKEKQSPKGPDSNKGSRKVGSSVPRLPDGIQKETPRSRNRKARSVSNGKHNTTPQVVDNPPKPNTRFDATAIASTSTVDEWVQVVRKKSRDIKWNPAPVKVVEKSKADHSDRSAIFPRIKESDSSEPKARFEHDIVLIRQLLNQLMPQNMTGVTLLKVYRLGSLTDSKPNHSRLLKVVFGSSNERDLILQNGHKLKGSGVFIRKDLPLADRVKRREAEKELQHRLDAGEKDLKIVNFRVVRLRQRMMPKPLWVKHEGT
ncbi:tRNA dimethylallyltransferase, variant 3 [Schistosoma haematobium]|uniref:tRNA dimethylallyltransferase, variant 3 n=1 Tax=Schistosoma haematobium TaxID=6185 RepID=A0A922LYP3_SCHHA|nr:tRNA dimethylallyltransferase, variant 3 [Schistosoma haematobium]KAH9596624.1 tRNA dimethylallyltransferase, variant 3 [Schistosoma haematobium]